MGFLSAGENSTKYHQPATALTPKQLPATPILILIAMNFSHTQQSTLSVNSANINSSTRSKKTWPERKSSSTKQSADDGGKSLSVKKSFHPAKILVARARRVIKSLKFIISVMDYSAINYARRCCAVVVMQFALNTEANERNGSKVYN